MHRIVHVRLVAAGFLFRFQIRSVWSTLFLFNVFTAIKGTIFYILLECNYVNINGLLPIIHLRKIMKKFESDFLHACICDQQ